MTRRAKPFSSLLAFVALAALIVVAPAMGAKPTRTVVDLEGDADAFVIPAGEGCAFAVRFRPSERSRRTLTEFSDGRLQVIRHAEWTLTNLATGDSFVQVSRNRDITFDAAANDALVETSGRIFITFLPGDQGPFGEVEDPGLLLSVIGHQSFTLDLDANAITAYSLDGQATDICALLSG
jgi:hypothetical protein